MNDLISRRMTCRVLALVLLFMTAIAFVVPSEVYGARKVIKVKKITLNSIETIRVGHSKTFKVKISPAKATNKKLRWKSSNSRIAKVSSKGKVTALKPGRVTITAMARDGSKKKASRKVIVYKLKKSSAFWIAHRGYKENAVENTAKAFVDAGELGFDGCEADVCETKPDENGNTELIMNHDSSFKRVQGVDQMVGYMTYQEIMNTPELSNVCTFNEYIDICRNYDMIPYIELKGLSYKGIHYMLDTLIDKEMLDKAVIISYHSNYLNEAVNYASSIDRTVKIGYALLTKNKTTYKDAVKYNFGLATMSYKFVEKEKRICSYYDDNDIPYTLFVGKDKPDNDNALYKCLVKKQHNVCGVMCDNKCW